MQKIIETVGFEKEVCFIDHLRFAGYTFEYFEQQFPCFRLSKLNHSFTYVKLPNNYIRAFRLDNELVDYVSDELNEEEWQIMIEAARPVVMITLSQGKWNAEELDFKVSCQEESGWKTINKTELGEQLTGELLHWQNKGYKVEIEYKN